MKEYTRRTVGYYNEIASAYVESSAAVVLQDQIDTFTQLVPGNRILDVACGPGHDTDYMSRKGFGTLGIDLSEEMIRIAKSRHNGKFEVMNFFNLPFEDNSFDGLWCSSALVHVGRAGLPQLLADFSRILVDNGILGIITVKKQRVLRDKSDKRKYVMYDKEELEGQLGKAGYDVLVSDIFPYGGKDRLFLLAINKK